MSDKATDWLTALRESDFGKAIRKQSDEARDAPAEREGDRWEGGISGFCPVQGWGSVENLFWYFRARSDCWRFEVYTEDTSGRLPDDDKLVWHASADYEGDAHNAGWMKYSEAWALIEECIATGRAAGWAMPPEGDE